MSEKTNWQHAETCGRCGHPKTEHVPVNLADEPTRLLLCPTALFLKDELQALLDKP